MARILVVDDEKDVLEFQKAFFTRRKHDVATASTKIDALSLIKDFKPEIIFCDLRLEDEEAGFDILLEAKNFSLKTVCYLITGLSDKALEDKALKMGAKEILTKPISNEELLNKINSAIYTQKE
ncbi:MAG: response regulator [Candidatus Omnitrophota bacterium]|jgi:DNA-binding response OmpR family regulator|nr:MAG: response regulator [Candidatus Omnitrophota bacterium]